MTRAEPPRYRTGALWVVLAVFLTVGTIAAAFFVYGVTDLLTTGRVLPDVPIALGGAGVATLFLLLITGILYRVDRLRGVPHRTVRMFD